MARSGNFWLFSLTAALLLLAVVLLKLFNANARTSGGPEDPTAWQLELQTSGGLTGKGTGGIVIDSNGAATASAGGPSCQHQYAPPELKALASLVSRSQPGRWRPAYARPGNPGGYADQIHYTLKLALSKTQGPRGYETSWYDETAESLPSDLKALLREAWKLRDDALAKCRAK